MSKTQKRITIFVALSAAVIIAGIILYALLGFNYNATKVKAVEVSYNSIATTAEKEEELAEMCEKAFKKEGFISVERDTAQLGETGDKIITFTFSVDTSNAQIEQSIKTVESSTGFEMAELTVGPIQIRESVRFNEAIWRGAIALGVAAIVALIYVGVRYGVASALTGLIAVVNDVFMTLGILAIARIPVYAYAPLLYAGLAAVLSVILWIVRCAKMKEHFKDPSYESLTAEEAVFDSCRKSTKLMLCFIIPFALALGVLGAVAVAGTRLFMLTALISVAASAYSSLFLAPAVLVPFKSRFDRLKSKSKRYVGKQKANAEQ